MIEMIYWMVSQGWSVRQWLPLVMFSAKIVSSLDVAHFEPGYIRCTIKIPMHDMIPVLHKWYHVISSILCQDPKSSPHPEISKCHRPAKTRWDESSDKMNLPCQNPSTKSEQVLTFNDHTWGLRIRYSIPGTTSKWMQQHAKLRIKSCLSNFESPIFRSTQKIS